MAARKKTPDLDTIYGSGLRGMDLLDVITRCEPFLVVRHAAKSTIKKADSTTSISHQLTPQGSIAHPTAGRIPTDGWIIQNGISRHGIWVQPQDAKLVRIARSNRKAFDDGESVPFEYTGPYMTAYRLDRSMVIRTERGVLEKHGVRDGRFGVNEAPRLRLPAGYIILTRGIENAVIGKHVSKGTFSLGFRYLK